MSRTRPVFGALAAAALLAAGCGSSGNDSGSKPSAPAKPAAAAKAAPAKQPSGPVPTKAAYVHRADAVCREARVISRRANTAVQKAFAANQAVKAADAIDRFSPAFAAKVTKLHALQLPKENPRLLRSLLKIMDAQVAALTAESQALRVGDSQRLQQISAGQQQAVVFAETLAKHYGFKVCGRAA